MNPKKLSNKVLDEKVIEIAKREKELIAEAIVYIAEVERRRMYLDMGFSSLFAYLSQHAKFSNGSAQRFIDAARLQIEVPSLSEKIEKGEINIAQVVVVAQAARQSKKEQRLKPTDQKQAAKPKIQKQELLESISNLTERESQVLVSQAFDLELKKQAKPKHQKDESVVLQITFTKEQYEDFLKAQEILSNSLPAGSTQADVLHKACQQVIQTANKKAQPRESTTSLTPAKKKLVKQTQECCQFKDPETGRICGTKFYLQTDHKQSQWAGGSHEIRNLQLLCANHNRRKYDLESRTKQC